MCFFGHIARLDEKAPATVALYEAIRPVKRLHWKPSKTLLSTIKKQWKELDIQDFHQAIILAQDRDNWRNSITRASFQKKTWLNQQQWQQLYFIYGFNAITFYT